LWLASPDQTSAAADGAAVPADGGNGHAGLSVSLSDTVGFIRDLPHKLVEAFEATLHEAAEADLLLHVIDAASPLLAEQQAEVERVLEEIGAAGVPQLLVYNKCDLLEDSRQSREESDWIEAHSGVRRQRVFVSAQTGQGLDALRRAIADAALQRLNAGVRPPPATLPDGSPVAASSSDTAPHQHA
jgi:GTP-binding protein HflX